MNTQPLHVYWKGQQAYNACWREMVDFTNARNETTLDQVWLVEHDPVFTQGQNGQAEHILNAGNIPIVKTDRGGQVTYHGPGQLMLYTLIDLKRLKINVRDFVCALEKSVIAFLESFNVKAYGKRDAPGVYVLTASNVEQKICSIGLRIRRGNSYHGIAFNVMMDLAPFSRINPCGYKGLTLTQLSTLAPDAIDQKATHEQNMREIGLKLTKYLIKQLGYTTHHFF